MWYLRFHAWWRDWCYSLPWCQIKVLILTKHESKRLNRRKTNWPNNCDFICFCHLYTNYRENPSFANRWLNHMIGQIEANVQKEKSMKINQFPLSSDDIQQIFKITPAHLLNWKDGFKTVMIIYARVYNNKYQVAKWNLC